MEQKPKRIIKPEDVNKDMKIDLNRLEVIAERLPKAVLSQSYEIMGIVDRLRRATAQQNEMIRSLGVEWKKSQENKTE